MIGILRAFDGDGFLAFDNSQGDLSAATSHRTRCAPSRPRSSSGATTRHGHRFDPEAWTAADVYPFGWDEDPEELWQGDLLPNLVAVRAFYARAAAAGHFVVLEIE